MPIVPYTEQIGDCLKTLNEQTAKFEVIIAEQPVEKYILKNKLLNDGFKQSRGEYVMHCDADFRFPDKTFLQRMVDKMELGPFDVIYPKFLSRVSGKLRIADGGPMFRREALLKHGRLDESLKGISWVTFPLLWNALNEMRFHCSDEFVLEVDQQRGGVARRNGSTASLMRPIFKKTVKRLKGMGAWPA